MRPTEPLHLRAFDAKAEIQRLTSRIEALEILASARATVVTDSDITAAFRNAIRSITHTEHAYTQFEYREGKFYFHDQDLSHFEPSSRAAMAVREQFGLPEPSWGVHPFK